MAETEQAVNKKAFAIDNVVGDCLLQTIGENTNNGCNTKPSKSFAGFYKHINQDKGKLFLSSRVPVKKYTFSIRGDTRMAIL